MKQKTDSAIIIGGGAVGLATALAVSELNLDVYVLEKNDTIKGDNQSTRNSGVIHAGIYYDPQVAPLKASLCVEGNERLQQFSKDKRVPFSNVGKLVVASSPNQIEYLDDVNRVAQLNGVKTKYIDGKDIKRYEPNVKGVCALHVPSSGIIQAEKYLEKLHAVCQKNGVHIVPGSNITDIVPYTDGFDVEVSHKDGTEKINTTYLINSAGLYSDNIARMVNPNFPIEITPVRGEAVKFDQKSRYKLNTNGMNVYPAPYPVDPKTGEKLDIPFDDFKKLYAEGKVMKTVGVHLTSQVKGRTLDDFVTVGPALVGGIEKDDYMPARENDYFVDRVNWFFPINIDDVSFHQTGILAKPKGCPDFYIQKDTKYPNMIQMVGIDSPGLTSSLAIGSYVKRMMEDLK